MANMLVRGSVDVVTGTEVRGWAYAPGQTDPVLVQVVLNYEILGEAVANIERPDLATAGLGDGRCGYVVKLYRDINPIYLPFLSVKVAGGDAELPRVSTSGFREFFSALHRTHPTAGRTRSVLGGLWTDRIDAAAVLRGKLAVGLLPPEAGMALGQLIQMGFTVMDVGTSPAAAGWTKVTPKAVASLLDEPAPLRLLQAVLEDNPLVVAAEMVRDAEMEFTQPTAGNPSPSPAECLAVAVPLKDTVVLDVVRDSHTLPEFTPSGGSRWLNGGALAGVEMAASHGVIDRQVLPRGSVAVIGPGAMYRLRCEDGGEAVHILCLPGRLTPVALASNKARKETVTGTGVRVLM